MRLASGRRWARHSPAQRFGGRNALVQGGRRCGRGESAAPPACYEDVQPRTRGQPGRRERPAAKRGNEGGTLLVTGGGRCMNGARGGRALSASGLCHVMPGAWYARSMMAMRSGCNALTAAIMCALSRHILRHDRPVVFKYIARPLGFRCSRAWRLWENAGRV